MIAEEISRGILRKSLEHQMLVSATQSLLFQWLFYDKDCIDEKHILL